MSKLQKMALLNLSLASVGLMLHLLGFFASIFLIQIIAVMTATILCCFLVASYFFRHHFTKHGGQYYDERDKLIHKNAAVSGFATSFFVLFLATMFTCLTSGQDSSLSIISLLGIFSLSAMSLFFAESIAILIQYGWGNENGQ